MHQCFPHIGHRGADSVLELRTQIVGLGQGGPRLVGRVMSLYVTVFAGTAPIGGLLAGTLAQAFGAAAAFSIGALLASAVLLLVAWRLGGARPPEVSTMAGTVPDAPAERDQPGRRVRVAA